MNGVVSLPIFTSVLCMDLTKLKIDPARVHVVYDVSKYLGSSGLRLLCQTFSSGAH